MPERSPSAAKERAETDDIVRSVLAGNPGVDGDGCCLGCGRLAERVADGAADGCAVCLAFLDWMGGDDDD